MSVAPPPPDGARLRRADVVQRTYEPYRSGLLSPQRVSELSRLRPWRAVADALVCWICIAAAWLAVARWPHWWVVLLALPVVGTRYYALFILGHDGLHRRLLPGRRANDLFNDLVILGPIGAITRINRVNHLEHHDYLASARDPDRHRYGCVNKADHLALLGYLTGLTSMARSARNVFLGSATNGRRDVAHPDGSYRPRDIVILVGWQALLLGALTSSIGWWGYPVLWLLPVFLFTVLGDNLRSFLEHSHPERDDLADRHRLITFLAHPLERMLLAPMNMNYHAAHHLWTSIPYYNLSEADREIRHKATTSGLLWRVSYLAYLWQYVRALPLDDCRASGEGDPARSRRTEAV
jgi:fatty acid desaturase